MAFADWTFAGDGQGELDPSIKYAGNSAYRTQNSTNGGINTLTHNTFSGAQAQVVFWARYSYDGAAAKLQQIVRLSTYGDVNVTPYLPTVGTWYKMRVTFWYDAASDTKFSKIEKWVDSAWVEQLVKNMGAGAAGVGNIVLKSTSESSVTKYGWFDEVEISA